MDVIKRAEWGGEPRRLTSMPTPQADIFVHHDAGAGPPGGARATIAAEDAYMRAVERYHVESRRFAAIAYSFLVFASGRVRVGRGWGKAGAHTYGHNTSSHGVCFVGNFQTARPTKAALRSARELIEQGIERGKVTRRPTIRGHRDVGAEGGSTVCPGNHLYAKLDELKPRGKP